MGSGLSSAGTRPVSVCVPAPRPRSSSWITFNLYEYFASGQHLRSLDPAWTRNININMEIRPDTKDDKIEPVLASVESLSEGDTKHVFTQDEYELAKLGYKQEFKRGLGLFENWAATFTSMNFASGIPVLFGFAMYTGGPTSAFANWTMVGGFSFIVSLSMAEIAAALPTAGGIYYWSYKLGGAEWGYGIQRSRLPLWPCADLMQTFPRLDDWLVVCAYST